MVSWYSKVGYAFCKGRKTIAVVGSLAAAAIILWMTSYTAAPTEENRWIQVSNRNNCVVWKTYPTTKYISATWDGACINGKGTGSGKLIWDIKKNNERFQSTVTGTLRNGKYSGRITVRVSDGTISEDEYRDGVLHGKRTVKSTDGTIYKEEYRDGLLNGKRTVKSTDGTVYEKEYRDGVLNGKSTIESIDGQTFSGIYQNGLLNGKALRKFKNGSKFTGQYKSGKINGSGTFVDANGTQYSGTWKDDVFTGMADYYRVSKNHISRLEVFERSFLSFKYKLVVVEGSPSFFGNGGKIGDIVKEGTWNMYTGELAEEGRIYSSGLLHCGPMWKESKSNVLNAKDGNGNVISNVYTESRPGGCVGYHVGVSDCVLMHCGKRWDAVANASYFIRTLEGAKGIVKILGKNLYEGPQYRWVN